MSDSKIEDKSAAIAAATTADGAAAPPKTEKELEKERKKAEKLAKFQAKEAKKKAAAAKSEAKKAKEPAASPAPAAAPVAQFVDKTVPGEKKILVSLDDPALKAYNPHIVESSWYDWWKKEGLFEPEFTEDGKIKPEGHFVVPAPPPNVTGALHIGHALTIAIQDSLIRFNRMRGKTTLFIPGFDHAGISTQSVVEKMLWNKNKITRHDLGREKFVDTVWEWKEEYHERIRKQVERLGASYDWSKEAFTLDDKRSKAVVEAFVRFFDDGTIYRANRLVNWCVALNTTLSNLEVENKDIAGRTQLSVPGYKEPVEFGVITSFAYPLEGSDEKIVVATTRPETMFGDTGIAVHPEDPRYKHLHGKFALHPFLDRKIPIITDSEAVDMEFGTGAVKITPSHDPNDYQTGKRHNLEFINIMNDDGTLNENAGDFNGVKRFDARKLVIEKLKEKELFIDQQENPMTIPFCTKSGDVIEPIMKPQWWVSQKEQAIEAIKAVKDGKITIVPKTSENEFFHWVNNIQDWCISRQLWWGHRCPVYFVNRENSTEEQQDRSDASNWVAGRDLEEAQKKAEAKFPNVKFTLEQDEDVLDTWFSAGLWPLTTLEWPNTKSVDLKNFYPMSLLETGWDILFFWVVRMIMMCMKLSGEVPFTEVFCHSLIRDAQGRKMSKSLGNVIDPLDVIAGIPLQGLHDKLRQGNLDPRETKKAEEGQKISFPNGIPECGTDALRFALCAYTTGGRDINLDIYRIEGYRKFCNKIYQATKFALMRLGDDYVPPASGNPSGKESLVEKWILHKLSTASKIATEALDKRDFLEATNVIYNFWLYEFCDIYIENSKYLILEGTPEEKLSAQNTLYTCLSSALELIHPFMPFITEELWQRLPRRPNDTTKSIVKASYPSLQAFDLEAESAYNLILEVVKGARSLLAQYGILKNATIIVQAADSKTYKIVADQEASILSLVKAAAKLEVTDSTTAPSGSVTSVISPECSVFVVVRGLVDFDAEIAKAQQKIEKTEKQKQSLEKSMSVKDYEIKVRKDVQESNTKRLENFNAEIAGLEATIANFQRLKLD
ncbi:valine--tRNA ligase [Sugiyamaella lignohabitans]|uniref:Valine--tRNA ligase, mitochondrial n=1 Tax=Sugiyamaella lignohabitans TaxID=796027 RepID=A0A167EK94_9ASCO|nr:valine--tRNA ligase [Sugiyamaella lignohabitans]ANB14175.1 valine--tRNA ligase [Sugiyamaella lignohabitans]